ncbi:MAG: DUF4412 domain-containing protein [Verrucomicrobiales bacterium]|nr:DUF4412 domain-containing protein [Verrucomicrobiales bacterium]
MKKHLSILTTAILCFGLIPAFAQFGRTPGGPKLDAAMSKLFGDNSAFTATFESQIKQPSGDTITMPGKISYDSGKTRMEMNMSEAKGMKMPPEAAEQMKSMGMDQMVTLTRPDKNLACIIYPGLESYAEMPLPAAKAGTNDNFKIETTELGKDTVDGHPCVENKVIVTGNNGVTNEFTVWNATDLKKFPVKIVHVEQGSETSMLFKNVSLTKPAASTFDVPAGYTRYDNMQTMMQTEMMKKMGGGMGMPPGGMPPNH